MLDILNKLGMRRGSPIRTQIFLTRRMLSGTTPHHFGGNSIGFLSSLLHPRYPIVSVLDHLGRQKLFCETAAYLRSFMILEAQYREIIR